MEDLLILIFQVVVELFINVPWDLFWYGEPDPKLQQSRAFTIGAWSLIIGALMGGISLWFFPNVISRPSWLRIFLLFFSPVFAGSTGYLIAKIRSASKSYVMPKHHFWWSCMFTMGYVIIRFTYAHRL